MTVTINLLIAVFVFTISCDCKPTGSYTRINRQVEESNQEIKNSTFIPPLSYEPRNGGYVFSYNIPNKISVKQRVITREEGGERVAGGTYSYTTPDGQQVVVTWVSDENGFRSKQRIGSPGDKGNPKDLLLGPYSAMYRVNRNGALGTIEYTWFVDETGLQLMLLLPMVSCGAVPLMSSSISTRLTRQADRDQEPASSTVIPIRSYTNEHHAHNASYKFGFKSDNGISVKEEGFPKLEEGKRVAAGTYSYTAPNGQLVVVTWYADENGFHSKQRIRHPTQTGPAFNTSELVHGPFKETKIIHEPTPEDVWTRQKHLDWSVGVDGVDKRIYHTGWAAGFRPIG